MRTTGWLLALGLAGGCTPTERCEDRLAELDRSMAALIAVSEPQRLDESVPGIERVPVADAGEPNGDCVLAWRPGMREEERARLDEDMAVHRAWRERTDQAGRGAVCVLLDAAAPLGPLWPELAALGREVDLALVVAAPWTPPTPPPLPAWVREWVEANPDWAKGTRSPTERLKALGPVIARADRCDREGNGHVPYIDTVKTRAATVHDWIEGCGCGGIDVPASAAILWLAYMPRLPPHRFVPLRATDVGKAALVLPPGATAQALVERLAQAPGAVVQVREDRSEGAGLKGQD